MEREHVPLIFSKFLPNYRESYLIRHHHSIQLLTKEHSLKANRAVEVEFHVFLTSQVVEMSAKIHALAAFLRVKSHR
jgi:hypothetical protein